MTYLSPVYTCYNEFHLGKWGEGGKVEKTMIKVLINAQVNFFMMILFAVDL